MGLNQPPDGLRDTFQLEYRIVWNPEAKKQINERGETLGVEDVFVEPQGERWFFNGKFGTWNCSSWYDSQWLPFNGQGRKTANWLFYCTVRDAGQRDVEQNHESGIFFLDNIMIYIGILWHVSTCFGRFQLRDPVEETTKGWNTCRMFLSACLKLDVLWAPCGTTFPGYDGRITNSWGWVKMVRSLFKQHFTAAGHWEFLVNGDFLWELESMNWITDWWCAGKKHEQPTSFARTNSAPSSWAQLCRPSRWGLLVGYARLRKKQCQHDAGQRKLVRLFQLGESQVLLCWLYPAVSTGSFWNRFGSDRCTSVELPLGFH